MVNKIKCSNCGAERELHHYITNQCPVGGREAPIGQKQEWQNCRFDASYYTIKLESDRDKLLEACKEIKSQIEFGTKVRGGLGHLAPAYTMLQAAIAEAEKGSG